MRRRYRLKPAGYLVLGVLALVIVLCIVAIANAISGGSKKTEEATLAEISTTPELVTATYTPVVTGTPEPSDAWDDKGDALMYNTGDPVTSSSPIAAVTPTPVAATATPAATPRVPTSKEKKNAVAGVIIADEVNMRSGPSTDYERLKKLATGDVVEIYAEDGDFYFLKTVADGTIGFVSKKFCQKTDGTTTAVIGELPDDAVLGTVKANSLAIRKAPDKESSCIVQVSKGATLFVYYKTGEFYYVETGDTGKKGFAFASYVDVEGDVPTK